MSSSPNLANNSNNLPARSKSRILATMRGRKREPSRTDKAEILRKETQEITLSEEFFLAGRNAALQAGCELLFEVPAMLIEDRGDRAAAVRCPKPEGDEFFFLVFKSADGSIAILAEDEVPSMLIAFTRSYAGVLGMIATDSSVTAPLLH